MTPYVEPPSSLERHNVRALTLDTAAQGVIAAGINVFVAVFLVRLGAPNALVGFLASAPALGAIFLSIPAGRYLEGRQDLVRVVNLSRVFIRLSYLAIALVPFAFVGDRAIWPVVILWTFTSIPAAIANPAWTTVVAKVIPPRRRPRVNGNRWAILSVITAIGGAGFGWMLDRVATPLNFQIVFVASFLAGIVSIYFFGLIRIPRDDKASPDEPASHRSMKHPVFRGEAPTGSPEHVHREDAKGAKAEEGMQNPEDRSENGDRGRPAASSFPLPDSLFRVRPSRGALWAARLRGDGLSFPKVRDAPSLVHGKSGRALSRILPIGEIVRMSRRYPGFARFTLASFVYRIGLNLPVALYSIYAVREAHASNTIIGLQSTAGNLALVASYLFWGQLAARRGHRIVLLAATAGLSFYPLATSLVVDAVWLIPATLIWGTFASGIDVSFFESLLHTCPSDRLQTFIAVNSAIANLVIFLAPIAGTVLADLLGIRFALVGAGAISLIGSTLFYILNVANENAPKHDSPRLSPENP